jgi:hypothetical protein
MYILHEHGDPVNFTAYLFDGNGHYLHPIGEKDYETIKSKYKLTVTDNHPLKHINTHYHSIVLHYEHN